jgi:hypothetical protein
MYLAVDNGKQGGIVAMSNDGTIVHHCVIPIVNKEYDINSILNTFSYIKDLATKKGENLVCILEKAVIYPGQGGKTNFTIGYQYGIMQGLLTALSIPFIIVTAQAWQKIVFKGMNQTHTKTASIDWCLRRYPHIMWKKSDRCVKYHDGLTDACCMAQYGREKQL